MQKCFRRQCSSSSLGLVPASDSYPQIHNEAERERLFEQKLVSIPIDLFKAVLYVPSQYHNIKNYQDSGKAALIRQCIQWATFTAKYLPSLVDRILDLPPHGARLTGDYPIRNIYHTALKFTHPAYLAKFMSSTHKVAEGASYLKCVRGFDIFSASYLEQGGKRLTSVIAERLVEFGPIWLSRGQR
jgi:hypothetical protein